MSRFLVVAAALALAVGSVAVSLRTTAPASQTAVGCNGPQVGALMQVFDTCAECELIGSEGASLGVWTTWRCRAKVDGFYLYAT